MSSMVSVYGSCIGTACCVAVACRSSCSDFCMLAAQLQVDRLMHKARLSNAVLLNRFLASPFSQRFTEGGVAHQLENRFGHRFRVARLDGNTAAVDLLRDAADSGRHHRLLTEHGLQHHKGKGLGNAGEYDHVSLIEGADRIGAEAAEYDHIFQF